MAGNPAITLININFPTRLEGSTYYYVPVGVLSLGAYLEKNRNIASQVLDYQHCRNKDPYNPDVMADFLNQAESDIVGISVMAKDLPLVLAGVELFKKNRPGALVILGGPGPTGNPKGIMEKFPHVDYIVAGEGEVTLLELMKSLAGSGDVRGIAGLVFRDAGGCVAEGPRRQRINNLDDLPFPAYNLIDRDLYNYIYIAGARGCSHFCTFCDQPALWNGCEIKRSVENLVEEVDYIRRELKAPWGIAFSDNEFCHDPQRFEEFVELIRRKGYIIPFSMDRRIDAISEESLKKARNAGCHSILYGIESASAEVLSKIKKDFSPDAIMPGLEMSSRYIKSSVASLIFNYPFETLKDFLETVNLVYKMYKKKSKNHVIFQLHYLAPLPRTPIFVKYRDRLVRRNVSSLMTSKDNIRTYRVITHKENKTILVLPRRSLEPIREDPRIKKVVEENPFLFPTHYVYDSPHVEIKERILDALEICLARGMSRVLFNLDNYSIYIGRDEITVAGSLEGSMPGVFIRLDYSGLLDMESAVKKILSASPRKVLLSIDTRDMPKDGQSGKTVLELMRRLRSEKADTVLLTHLGEDYLGFIPSLRLTREFGMPREPHESGDNFYIDHNDIIRTLEGRAVGHVSSYDSAGDIFRDITEGKFVQ